MKIMNCENQLKMLIEDYHDLSKVIGLMHNLLDDSNEYQSRERIFENLKTIVIRCNHLKIFKHIVNEIDISEFDKSILELKQNIKLPNSVPREFLTQKYINLIDSIDKYLQTKNASDKLLILMTKFYDYIDEKILYDTVLKNIEMKLQDFIYSVEIPIPDIIEDDLLLTLYINYTKGDK